MSIAEKITVIADNEPLVYDAGKKYEYDKFWDAFQEKGARTNYDYAFYGYGWRTENFKPKYTIKANRCARAFFNSLLSNLTDCTLDTSECTAFSDMFNNAWGVSRIPPLDMRKLTDASNGIYIFSSGTISVIDRITVCEDTRFAATSFYGASGLESLTLEGTLACGLDLHWSKKLSADSIISAVDALSDAATGLTLTLPSCAEETVDAEYPDYWALLISKKPNWTIALV